MVERTQLSLAQHSEGYGRLEALHYMVGSFDSQFLFCFCWPVSVEVVAFRQLVTRRSKGVHRLKSGPAYFVRILQQYGALHIV